MNRIGGRERLPAGGKWLATIGCRECKETGFKGRVAIHEFLQVSDELRDLISRHAPEHDMRRAARAAGMRTLLEDGILKASLGMTTLEAVLEVVSASETAPTATVTAPSSPRRPWPCPSWWPRRSNRRTMRRPHPHAADTTATQSRPASVSSSSRTAARSRRS